MRTRRTIATALTALLLVAPMVATSQFGNGGDQGNNSQNSRPWEQFKLDAKKKLKLTFRNASADAVIRIMMCAWPS